MDSVQTSPVSETQQPPASLLKGSVNEYEPAQVEAAGFNEPTPQKPGSANSSPCMTRIEIYTDGSCIGNPGHGGWGVVIVRRDVTSGLVIKRAEVSGYAANETTNIKMEMTAPCMALRRLGPVTEEPIAVFCDLDLIPNAMNHWLSKWKAKGWKMRGEAIKNRDLWEQIELAAAGRNVTWYWVRGHSGSEHNERADQLACAASKKAEGLFGGP
jgi:ribonuclease HI